MSIVNNSNKTKFTEPIIIVIIFIIYLIMRLLLPELGFDEINNIFNISTLLKVILYMLFFILRFTIALLLPFYLILKIVLLLRKIKYYQIARLKTYFYIVILVVSLFFNSILKAPGDVSGWFKNDKSTQVSYMSSIKSILHKQIDLTSENNIYGSGQWVFVNYAMAGYGFGQIAIAHPELKDSCLKEMKFCIEKLLSDKVKEFDVEAWGEDPIETLNGPNEHVAYLGYLNLLLGMHRMLDKNSEFARLNDTITHTLVKRFEKNNRFLLETYPGVIFPADNAPAIGSIGLYSKATGSDYKAFLKKWTTGFKELYIDKETKIPVQSIAPVIGPAESKTDVNNFSIPRGSGAAACIYFLSFADKELAESIYNNLKKELKVTFGAFGAVKEYPAKYKNHKGDVDSGPVVLGMSISATGFVVSGAKVFNDYPFFKKLCSLVYLVGIPEQKSKSFRFKIAGNMGNAMMFAMLTANTKLLAN